MRCLYRYICSINSVKEAINAFSAMHCVTAMMPVGVAHTRLIFRPVLRNWAAGADGTVDIAMSAG